MTSKSRTLVVGDIHGAHGQLQALLRQDALFKERVPVFVGDYVDVGIQSRETVQALIELKVSNRSAVFLKGNHDLGFMRYMRSGQLGAYACMGGISTIRSYCGVIHGDVHRATLRSVPASHREFFESLDDYFETTEYLISHAGYSPAAPDDRSTAAMVLGTHQDLFRGDLPLKKLCVSGHYSQRTQRPLIRRGYLCVDTGCGLAAGPLTAVCLPELLVTQVWPSLFVETFQLAF